MLAEDAIKAAIRDYHAKVKAQGLGSAAGAIDVSQSAATGETVATPSVGAA